MRDFQHFSAGVVTGCVLCAAMLIALRAFGA